MPYNTVFLSIRIKLDDVVKEESLEKQIIENIRYCRRVIGKEFKVIFWNQSLTENEVKDFVKRNNDILFEINTEITKEFNLAWFVVGEEDKSKHRYLYTGDILNGISNFLKLAKLLLKRRNDESSHNR